MSSWPRWMTLPVVSAASSLLSWDQLSGGLQRALEPLGGAYDSWVVHHAPEAFYVTGSLSYDLVCGSLDAALATTPYR